MGLALGAALWPGPAAAVTACSVSATGIAFGNYSAAAPGPTDVDGRVTVSCLALFGEQFNYRLALTVGGGRDYNNRRLSSPGGTLAYQVFLNPSRTLVWGDGSAGTDTVGGSLGTGSRDHGLYGRILARQRVAAGVYTDALVVVATY